MLNGGVHMFRRIQPKRPTVIRKGDKVKVCYLYKGTKQCLGPQCYWPIVGSCPHFNRLKSRRFKGKLRAK